MELIRLGVRPRLRIALGAGKFSDRLAVIELTFLVAILDTATSFPNFNMTAVRLGGHRTVSGHSPVLARQSQEQRFQLRVLRMVGTGTEQWKADIFNSLVARGRSHQQMHGETDSTARSALRP